MNLIGLDIGTTSICGVLLDSLSGVVTKRITRHNKRAISSQRQGERIQDAPGILRDVTDVLRQLSDGIKVDGIGVTGQMHGILYVNETGAAVSPLYTWQDEQGNLPLDDYDGTYVTWLSERSGYPMSTGFGLVTHAYLALNQLLQREAVKMCTIVDFVAMSLVDGTNPRTESTNAASLGCFDVANGCFDADALVRCNIDVAWLPQVVPSGTCLGTWGNTPVFVGIGDNQASFLGGVQSVIDSLLVNIGTGAQIAVYSPTYVTASRLETRPYMDGGYLLVGATLAGGKSYAMLEQFFRSVCEELGYGCDESLYSRMEQLLPAAVALSDGLQVSPQFAGTRENPEVRGSITNISLDNFKPAFLVEGFLRGIAEELLRFVDNLPPETRRQLCQFVGSGNGLRKNRALQQMVSHELGLPLVMSTYEEEAALGAALHAGVGLGVYPNYLTAAEQLK